MSHSFDSHLMSYVNSQRGRAGFTARWLTVSALRDSHGIGANADVVLAMYEPERRGDTKDDRRQKIELHFAKNRFGPDTMREYLEFDGAYSRFKPWKD